MKINNDKVTIKDWSAADRPREKLLLKGSQALSDAELIAILIGSGNRELSAVELSRKILRAASENLHQLARWDIADLMQYKGIGEAKAISIVAALELGRRKALTDPVSQKQLISSQQTYQTLHPLIADLNHEEFWVLYLNQNNRLLSKVRISSGGVSATVVDVRMILKKAINQLASVIILAHNHPSGNLKPSKPDIAITEKVKNAAQLFDITLADHLIISQRGYYSFADEGML